MFRIVSIIAFAATLGGIGLHYVALPWFKGRRWTAGDVLKKLVYLLTLLFVEQKLSPVSVLRKIVYLVALLCFVVLAVTGFFPLLVLDEHISGYLMMVHASFAPVFAVCLAALAVMWARHCHFTSSDLPSARRIIERLTLVKSYQEKAPSESTGIAQKITFWLLIFLALPLILSIVLIMLGCSGTHQQISFLAAHRHIALLFSLIAIVHTYLMIRTQIKSR